MDRTFNSMEEAVEAWNREAEKALLKRGYSGILCECCCYRKEDEIKSTSPIRTCTLLVPENVYRDFAEHTDARYKDPAYKFPCVAVLSQGFIRVRFCGDERNDYATKQNLCENSLRVEELLKRYLGKKIRLGKNILAK